MKYFGCIDIGGTYIKYGIINEKAEFIFSSETPTGAENGGSYIINKTKRLIYQMNVKCNLSGICISTAGIVDREGVVIHAAPLIPNYAGINIKQALQSEFSLPCSVENDVRCAGLAEAVMGAAAGKNSALCITVGSGIGGCIIIDGKIWRGASGVAGEIGYLHMNGEQFQNLGAVSVLVRNTEKALGLSKFSLDGKAVFKKASEGNEICREMIFRMTEIIGAGIANICYIFNPEIVVVGGGIAKQGEKLRADIEKAMKKNLIPIIGEKTELVLAKHLNKAGMLGSFLHFQKQYFSGKQ